MNQVINTILNTNLAYALSLQPDKGNLRETFLYSQLKNIGKVVTYPKKGDFKVGNYVFEVGGKQKKKNQIAEIPNSYIISDDILTGFGNKIPLWIMGLMY